MVASSSFKRYLILVHLLVSRHCGSLDLKNLRNVGVCHAFVSESVESNISHLLCFDIDDTMRSFFRVTLVLLASLTSPIDHVLRHIFFYFFEKMAPTFFMAPGFSTPSGKPGKEIHCSGPYGPFGCDPQNFNSALVC